MLIRNGNRPQEKLLSLESSPLQKHLIQKYLPFKNIVSRIHFLIITFPDYQNHKKIAQKVNGFFLVFLKS